MSKIEQSVIDRVLKGEHWRDNVSGLKWTPQLRDCMMSKHLHEIKLWRCKDELDKLKRAHTLAEVREAQGNSFPRMIDSSCVAALRSKSDYRIKEIAFNRADDMF